MKTYFTLLLLQAMVWNIAFSQPEKVFEQIISNAGNKEISIDLNYPSLEIETWSKNEIAVEGHIEPYLLQEEDNFELNINQTTNKISITLKNDDDESSRKVVFMQNGSEKQILNIKSKDWKVINKEAKKLCPDCNINVNTLAGMITLKIKVPESAILKIETLYGDNKIKDFYGSLNVDATYGGVTVLYTQGEPKAVVDLQSTYDFVDITLPVNANLDLDLKTSYGEVFSNFDVIMNANAKDESPYGHNIGGKINGGGPLIKAVATYDNVYLRKL